MTELEKYQLIYNSKEYSYYGHTNHGKNSYPLIDIISPRSIIDVGCGHNEFCNYFRQKGICCVGVDFACLEADMIASATNLPFNDDEFDLLTSFDTLEHLLPTEIDITLLEFKRIASKFLFSISYVPSKILVKGENLHPSVFPESWWISKLQKMGTVIKYNNYIYVE